MISPEMMLAKAHLHELREAAEADWPRMTAGDWDAAVRAVASRGVRGDQVTGAVLAELAERLGPGPARTSSPDERRKPAVEPPFPG